MTNETKQQLAVWWFLWAAFQTGIVILFYVLGGKNAALKPPVDTSSLWLAAAVPCLFSAVMRWLVIPRFSTAQAALPFFVMGIAFAEATCFLGLFIFPAHKQDLFLLSFLGILQFVPFFARRFFPEDEN
jgi:hypothetical protein